MLKKLEKYELLTEIGHGGMATVYEARDSRLDRSVAVKVMHPHLQKAKEARARFTREAKSVARLRHPNILEIYDNSDEGSEESYIVTELLTGPTLKEFAEKNDPIPAEIAACFTILVARALACAHEAKIIHRDVKPENVLLHEQRTLKLTDFGIAQMVDAQSMTATGQILGSPGHMAPEQVEHGDVDERSDVFSLGTVLYYLATGRLPFHGRNPHQVLRRIMDNDYADPIRIRPGIGSQLRAIIKKALSKNPDDRYQTAREMERDLGAFLLEMGIEEPEVALAEYMHDPEARTETLRHSSIERLIKLGTKAADDGDVRTSLDYFNRVLGLDEGNERVLGLIDQVGRHGERRRARIFAVGIGLAVLGALGILVAFDSMADRDASGPAVVEDTLDVEEASPEVIVPESVVADAASVARAPADAGVRLASAGTVKQRVVPATQPQHTGNTRVELQPRPMSVRVTVDGNTYPVGRTVELSPGPHEFRFEGRGTATVVETIQVPARPDWTLSREIPWAPADVLVQCSPGDVEITSGGRTLPSSDGRPMRCGLIHVSVEQPQTPAVVEVTSGEHRGYTGRVVLTPGEAKTVTLQPPREASPAP